MFGFMGVIFVGDLGFGLEFFVGFGLLLFSCFVFMELLVIVDFFNVKFSFFVFLLVIVIFFVMVLYLFVWVVIL